MIIKEWRGVFRNSVQWPHINVCGIHWALWQLCIIPHTYLSLLHWCDLTFPSGDSDFFIDVARFDSGLHRLSVTISTLLGQELTTATIIFSVFRKLQKAQPHWAYVNYTKVLLQYITAILYNVHCMLYCVIAGPELTCFPLLGSRVLSIGCSSFPEAVDFATCSYDNLPAFRCKQPAIVYVLLNQCCYFRCAHV